MRDQRGLPIAAHLGLLVALAFVSAFIGIVAVVIWLPPRPPDVMRADMVAQHFADGYAAARTSGHAPGGDTMEWTIASLPPSGDEASPFMEPVRGDLARHLGLRPEQIRLGASHFARGDVFVFRVRDAEERMQFEHHLENHRMIVRVPEGQAPHAQVSVDLVSPPPPGIPPPRGAPIARNDDASVTVELQSGAPSAPIAPSAPLAPAPRAAAPAAPAPPLPPPLFAPPPHGVALISGFRFAAQLPDGRWLVMRQGRNWAELGWIGRAALIVAAALATLSLLALLFARQLAKPIQYFADAVQAVGVDPQSAPVLEEGPRELRGAARAVNAMQARLRSLVADRTKTLAAVAHDMRTPLMRLRLTAENAPPEQRERMAKEIGEVEALVASFIAFARDDPAEEARVRVDLSALLQSLTDDHAEHGRNVSFTGEERVIITGQSLGLKRLFGNLIDNALKYGAAARVKLERGENTVIVDVEDDGSGIPAEQRESVFEPFVRLNEEGTRGAGLGLAAARSIARAHGGDVVILDSATGARVRVTLPS
ncbi:MAG: HAMP domain-containing protein [Proteobacteria bacterium]|nr:HAMP domain-containing protein [Pseudomonadota bacterium]